jgi:hypothetical protein
MAAMNKYLTKTVPFTLVFLWLTIISGCHEIETVRVDYFYASQCNDCEEAGEILKTIDTKISYDGRPLHLDIKLYNILGEEGWDALMETLERTKVPATAQHMPLLFIGDQWFYGEEEIMEAVDGLRSGQLPRGVTVGPSKSDDH